MSAISVVNPILLILAIIFALEIVVGIPMSIYYFATKPSEIKKQKRPVKKLKEDKKKYTLVEFLCIYKKGFVKFAEGNFMKKNPPFLKVLIYIEGVIFGLYISITLINQMPLLPLIIGITVVTFIFGPFVSYLIYYINGFFYHIAVYLAGGKRDMTVSRNISMYVTFPYILIVLLLGIVTLIARILNINFDIIMYLNIGLFVIVYFYSLILGYLTVLKVHRSSVLPTVIIFLILPIILNLF